MYSKSGIKTSTEGCLRRIERLQEALEQADAVVIGAGAGLSASAGFTYSGERFEKYFGDFIARYGFSDMYSGGFHSFATLEEHWAYWSRYIYINRYMDAPKPVYDALLQLVRDKDYFVLTTNVDHCFQKAGFEKRRLFYTQGDYGLWQCSLPCHNKTYDNEQAVRQMVRDQRDMRIPSELIPHCPVCGAPMAMNLRTDRTFVEDEAGMKPPGATRISSSAIRACASSFGIGRGWQHAGHHQISLLANDLPEPESGLCLR